MFICFPLIDATLNINITITITIRASLREELDPTKTIEDVQGANITSIELIWRSKLL